MIGAWLESWSRFGAERTALVCGVTGRRWSYRELFAASQRRAAWLLEQGVRPGDRVAWVAKNEPQFFEALFACARIGAVLVPVNWRLAAPEVAWILEDCAPAVTITSAGLAAEPGWDKATPVPPVRAAAVDPDDALLILYTSGTTGRPKGALLTHRSINANSLHTGIACELTARDATVTYTPLFHTGGINVLSLPILHRGGKVVLLPGFDAERILALGAEEACTILFGVPTTFAMLQESPAFATADLRAARFALCGGAPCPVELIHAYAARGVTFRQGYGLTEVGPNCFSLLAEDAVRKAGTVGFPVVGCEAKLVDAAGAEVAPGEVGELLLRGEHVCKGYWRNEAATRDARRPGGFWATGDLFTVDDEGYFRVVGRKKEMFISGGENVYPAEVEAGLRALPAVKACAVLGMPSARWGEVGCAFVTLAEGHRRPSDDELKRALRAQLAGYKVPKAWVWLEALPLTASGKTSRPELQRLLPAGVGAEALVASS